MGYESPAQTERPDSVNDPLWYVRYYSSRYVDYRALYPLLENMTATSYQDEAWKANFANAMGWVTAPESQTSRDP